MNQRDAKKMRGMGGREGARSAFTLAELIVVIAIFAILLAAGVPAFNTILRSSNESLAEQQLRLGLGAARDAALAEGTDAAAVFFFTPGGRTTIAAYVKVGEMQDKRNSGTIPITREVFAPVSEIAPVQMPAGVSVRAMAPYGSLDADQGGNVNERDGWYAKAGYYDGSNGAWVFPETGFYDSAKDVGSGNTEGYKRQTFMVRFDRRGRLALNDPRPVICIAPGVDVDKRADVTAATRWERPDLQDDLRAWGRRMLNRSWTNATEPTWRIGNASPDKVTAAGVSVVAVYNEKEMAGAIGLRGLNETTGTLYKAPDTSAGGAEVDGDLTSKSAQAVHQDIDKWLLGEYPDATNPVQTSARLFSIDPLTGDPVEVSR